MSARTLKESVSVTYEPRDDSYTVEVSHYISGWGKYPREGVHLCARLNHASLLALRERIDTALQERDTCPPRKVSPYA